MEILKSFALAAIVVTTFGCASQSNTNTVTANQSRPTAISNQTSTAPTTSSATTNATTVFSLATPTDAYRTAYGLRQKTDHEGLKKVLSKDVMEFLTMMGEGENKSLDDEIKTMFDKPQAKTIEVRNEQIKGDRATIEYLDETGNWKIMDFVKEGNEWKMALPPKEDIKVESGIPEKKPKK